MTREETKNLLPIIEAYAEGKTIQKLCKTNHKISTAYWEDVVELDFNLLHTYRIKPEPAYRPFKDKEECWQEMLNHQPFGWIRNQNTGIREYITYVDDNCIMTMDEGRSFTFRNMLNKEDITFADGTPFGIREE